MDNSTCYWCELLMDKDDEEKYYYCTYSHDELVPCDLFKPCFRYIASDKVSDYIRHLLKEIELMELTKKLP